MTGQSFNGKVVRTNNKSKKIGNSSLCLTKSGNLCFNQVNKTTICTSSVTKQNFNINC